MPGWRRPLPWLPRGATRAQTRTTTYAYTGAAGLLASVDGPLAGAGDTVAYTYDEGVKIAHR